MISQVFVHSRLFGFFDVATVTSVIPVAIFALLLSAIILINWITLSCKFSKSILQTQGYLRNYQGCSIAEIAGNTRFSRFSNGYELSRQGAEAAKDGPYLIWNDGVPEIVLSKPEHVKEFYSRRAREHAKPPNGNMGHYFNRILGVCVGVQNGQNWKGIRKVFDPHFSHKSAMGFMKTFAAEIQRWRQELAANGGETGNFVLEATSCCRILPFKLVALACYGPVMTDKMFEDLLQLNVVHEKIMSRTFFGRKETSWLYNLLPTAAKKEMDFFQQQWKLFNMRAIREAETKDIPSPVKDMYQQVLSTCISETEFLQTVDEILFANLDVTSSILAFLLINLAANKTAQEELRSEILSYLPKGLDASLKKLEAYVQKTDTLLEYTCMESTRLCPAAWFTLPEYATTDLNIDGYKIRASTFCIIDWTRLNTESPVWTPQKQEADQVITGKSFYPQRFRTMSPTEYRWSFLRFGLGGRQCLGKNFGGVIMKQFLIEVLNHYNLYMAGYGESIEKSGNINAELRKDRFTITPRQEVKFMRL